MASEAKPHSTLLKKILHSDAGAAPDESPESLRDARPAIPTPMLDLVLRNGTVESFSYAYLTHVTYEPGGRLTLHFADDVVVIEGRNLGEIRQKIRMHKASEIYEGIEAEEALKSESAAHVERIHLTTAKEEESHDTRRGQGTN